MFNKMRCPQPNLVSVTKTFPLCRAGQKWNINILWHNCITVSQFMSHSRLFNEIVFFIGSIRFSSIKMKYTNQFSIDRSGNHLKTCPNRVCLCRIEEKAHFHNHLTLTMPCFARLLLRAGFIWEKPQGGMACRNIKHKSGAQPSQAERVRCRRQEGA